MQSFGIIGCGNFGSCALHRLSKLCHCTSYYHPTKKSNSLHDVLLSDVVLLTIKPSSVKEVCLEIRELTKELSNISSSPINNPLFVSAVAGVPLHRLREDLGTSNVARVMYDINYNSFGWNRDIFVYTTGEEILQRCEKYLQPLGKTNFLSSDEEVDKITALIGCGPALVASVVNAYHRAGLSIGVDDSSLVQRLFKRVVDDLDTTSTEDIIKRVASKGGATEQALRSLDPIDRCLEQAVKKAFDKCQSISKEDEIPLC